MATEPEIGLGAALIQPDGGPVTLHHAIDAAPAEIGHPETAFRPRANRCTTAADNLASANRASAEAAGGGRAGIGALVAETEARFTCGHPATTFNDRADAAPHLSCGLTPGCCVDIDTCLVASLRAAGYEAAYIYGFHFPEAQGGLTGAGHCRVATPHAGELLEWDIAHHLEAGLEAARPGLNPWPGERVAPSHTMGQNHVLPNREATMKLLGAPMRLPAGEASAWVTTMTARLSPFGVAH